MQDSRLSSIANTTVEKGGRDGLEQSSSVSLEVEYTKGSARDSSAAACHTQYRDHLPNLASPSGT